MACTIKYYEGTYVGDLDGAKKHGRGIMKYTDGNIYDGEWHNDFKHGMGTFIWPDGSKYVGKFIGGSFGGGEGQGVFISEKGPMDAIWMAVPKGTDPKMPFGSFTSPGSFQPRETRVLERAQNPQIASMNRAINNTLSACQIEFAAGESYLLPEGKAAVKRVADILRGYGAVDIDIHGHTLCSPCTGQCQLLKLASDRTDAVKRELMELAPKCKLTTRPWGCKHFSVGPRKLVRIGTDLD
jgi:hypothetical protein